METVSIQTLEDYMKMIRSAVLIVLSLFLVVACGDTVSSSVKPEAVAGPSKNFYACESGWQPTENGYICDMGAVECDGSAASRLAGCAEHEIALCDASDPLSMCSGSGSGMCYQYAAVTGTCGSGGGVGVGGGSGSYGPPPEDSVSYEEVVAATDGIMQQIDEHVAEWNTPPVGMMGEALSPSAQLVFTPETALDLLVLGYDVTQLVVAGPSAGRLTAVLADLGAVIIPGVPSPGSIRVAAQGAKTAKSAFKHTERLWKAAKIGRVYHAEKSAYLWQNGHIGATRIVVGSTIRYVDGAVVNRAAKTITLIEIKPANAAAIAKGREQLAEYVGLLSQKESWTVYNKFTNASETFILQGTDKWRVFKDDAILQYSVDFP